jgi:hypothetical protein
MLSAKQQNCKHVYINRYFLWSPCQGLIEDSEGRLKLVKYKRLKLGGSQAEDRSND